MLYVTYFSAPFVSYVHVRLPIFARRSREQLLRWAKRVSPSTEIDLTTMRFYGRPSVSRMPLSDLRKIKTNFSVANLVRTEKPLQPNLERPWWMPKPRMEFYVGKERGKSREASVWRMIFDRIPKV